MITKLVANIFPQLTNQRWIEIRLDDQIIQQGQFTNTQDDNPLLDPVFFQEWLTTQHLLLNADHSYGGYAEDRSKLWKGHYMIHNHPIHLGLDINVPPTTTVHSPIQGRIVQNWTDTDQKGGWGGRIIIEIDQGSNEYLLIAHLEPKNLTNQTHVNQNDPIGTVADHITNGNWYPHTHVQYVKGIHWSLVKDGYGTKDDLLFNLNQNSLEIL